MRRLAIALVWLSIPFFSMGQTATYDFDDIQDIQTLTTQLTPKGIYFPSGVIIFKTQDARVGIISGSVGNEFDFGPMHVEFTTPRTAVRIKASVLYGGATTATLKAFDASGNMVVQDGPRSIDQNFGATQFSVSTATDIIKRIEFQASGNQFEIVDQLEADGPPVIIDDLQQPGITITQAIIKPETFLDKNELLVTGKIKGQKLLPGVRITIEYNHPPSDHSGNTVNTVAITANNTFSFKMTNPPFGPLRITASIKNINGDAATDNEQVSNFPKSIITTVNTEQAAHPLVPVGNFLWGMRSGTEYVFIYEHLGVNIRTIRQSGNVFGYSSLLVYDPILAKWLSVKDEADRLKLGLPVKGKVKVNDRLISQDFKGGRIYSHDSIGTYFVPPAFVNAIDKLGNELHCGFPVADPQYLTARVHNSYTSLYQKFTREQQWGPNKRFIPTVMEIKGRTPKLQVQRVGGDLRMYDNIVGLVLDFIPPIYNEYDCTGPEGPCNVRIPVPTPRPESTRSFCKDGTSYEEKAADLAVGGVALFAAVGGVGTIITAHAIPKWMIAKYLGPQWPAIRGDNVMTKLAGIVTASEHTRTDLWLNHSYYTEPCPVAPPILPWASGSISMTALLDAINALDGDAVVCPSDWNVRIKPFTEYEYLLGRHQTTMKMEIEDYFFRPFRFFSYDPKPGDMIFTAGRWVVDCGHPSFNTEIHPPAVVVLNRNRPYNGKPATVGFLYVNLFYTGEPIEFIVYPPPRPSPRATLAWAAPMDNQFYRIEYKEDVTHGYLKVRFWGTHTHTSSVTGFGEMLWSYGGGHVTGAFYVYWDD